MALLGLTPAQIKRMTFREWYLGVVAKLKHVAEDRKINTLLMRTQTELILNMFTTEESGPVKLAQFMPVTEEEVDEYNKYHAKSKDEKIDTILEYWKENG